MITDYTEFCEQIKNCKSCRLEQTRNNAVCGEGIIPTKLMFIAQAPGRTEDKKGKMFIGPSGKIFDQLLCSIGLNRNEIYLTNLLKCFLPKCRKPRHDEMNICYNNFLKHEIGIVKPEIIITLGFHVTRYIFEAYNLPIPNKFEIKNMFGKIFFAKNQKILPLKHPATIVHKSKSFDNLKQDYQILKTLLNPCPKLKECKIPKQYKKGLLTEDYIEQFCYGIWEKCKYYDF
ncbi:MAG: hypothetical protein A2W99_03995 [Bacteroidetes bacterium GWF2_33_16]|nr:MAG: hypothetical protein A2X00_07210 [Bacteroidetes bacterium GWE2_32_14]OFY02954.1 MAG: hypothetical protein A2W99_03995 [Bacteroidetes bacterium GWF2_33_16]